MHSPRCARCGSVQPAGRSAGAACAYCGAVPIGNAPPLNGRVRWVASPPLGSPAARRPVARVRPYSGPPTYGVDHPGWGFAPSVWSPPPDTRAPGPSVQDTVIGLRTVTIFARATAVACLLGAVFEAWRYVLMARGRTEVLPATQVLIADASVASAGWVALLLGIVTVIALLPVLSRTAAVAAARADARPSRTAGQRLSALLIPGWNLYGAGAVFAELDALLLAGRGLVSVAPEHRDMRWMAGDIPQVSASVNAPAAGAAASATGDEAPGAAAGAALGAAPAGTTEHPSTVHHRPGRLVACWWAAWIVNGMLVAAELARMVWQNTLQARADLVAIHIAVALAGAVVAALTAQLLVRFSRLLQPLEQVWNPEWVMVPPVSTQARPAAGAIGPHSEP